MNTNKRNYGLYALALAIAFVGALVLGVPVEALVLLAIVAACPLMMFFMMRGMHGGQGKSNQHTDETDPLRKHDQ
ncbi:DUF2933 domain-containing protein [Streptomyces sp. TRM68367]|uniref:DUF2933 domain-containing protein n=1 Tax=Streptomyces sp. TRM68367 TaxID=2758415 RepID=UPI00165AE133|nr:DUF2933 domain-containing protein [Streptomyces sp. TRM68367]MBC9725029.1 DUF2933 domain-containing protein [Streptomyces sp. TRM68367]